MSAEVQDQLIAVVEEHLRHNNRPSMSVQSGCDKMGWSSIMLHPGSSTGAFRAAASPCGGNQCLGRSADDISEISSFLTMEISFSSVGSTALVGSGAVLRRQTVPSGCVDFKLHHCLV
jgi:hypothetical protein